MSEEETEYPRYKEMMHTVFYEINNMEQKLIDIQVAFDDAQRSNAAGLANVYAKFIEIEKRQKEIEYLLRRDHMKEMIQSI